MIFSMNVSSLDLQLIVTLLIDQQIFIQIKTMCASLFVIYLKCLFSNSYQKILCFNYFSINTFSWSFAEIITFVSYSSIAAFNFKNLNGKCLIKEKEFDHNFMHWLFCIVLFYINPKY